MRLFLSEAGVSILAPAKLNLFFEVLQRRTDGYHEIESLMCPVDLCDTVVVRDDPTGQLAFALSHDGGPLSPDRSWIHEVPSGPENLVVRAIRLLRQRSGVDRGAAVQLTKRIPSAAGLGGGSSDAAAALVAANVCWKLGYSPTELASIAAEIGSDVPFFVMSSPAVCRGRGEKIETLPSCGAFHFVLVRPAEGLSTASVYRECRPAERPESLAEMLAAFAHGDAAALGRRLFNRLQEPAARLCPGVERLRYEFDRLDCLGHAMTGSGTCYFGVCRHRLHARRIARRLQARRLGSVYVVRSCI
jgi:4-diphosphocytidyl-2-C-methyl-D-erythritol kinase